MPYRNFLAKTLSSLRKSKDISMAELGRDLGVSDETIRLLERGKRSPSFELFISLADFFDVSLDYLVGRSNDPQRR